MPAPPSVPTSTRATKPGATAISTCRIAAKRVASAAYQPADFAAGAAFTRAVGESWLAAYLPIVEKRKGTAYGEGERAFQLYRRGRYVEFNLLYDRGTHFGLQSGGRTESILMSLPPLVRFTYDYQPAAGSAEARLADYLKPREWL